VLLIGLLSLVLPGAPEASAQDAPQRFTSAVDVVSVTAVVRDRRGRLVRDLDRADFTVIEGGQARPLLDVRLEAEAPVRLAVLVDVSGSMRVGGRAVDARLAAQQLFSALRPGDEAAVYAFDTQLERMTGFTADPEQLQGALDSVMPPFGQTSILDAVAQAAQETASQAPRPAGPGRVPARLAIVLLTDGIDTSSRLSPSEVMGIAGEIDVPVYVLAVLSPVDDPRHHPDGKAAQAASELGNLSRWTGGELFTASAPAHASIAARQIVDELRHQYVLAFEASPERGWRPVEVRARNPRHSVRTRAGYMAGTERPTGLQD